MSLQQIYQKLLATISLVKKLVVSAHQQDATGNFIWTKEERIVITEAAFLRLFKGWENFLEQSFHAYMMGNGSIAGNTLNCFVQPRDLQHARDMVIGMRPFVDWGTPDTVRKLSGLFFDGNSPFETAISAIHGDLNDLKTIRNAAAHLSSTTSAPLDALASRRLQKAINGINVCDFILSADPANTGQTVIESYIQILSAAGHQITNI